MYLICTKLSSNFDFELQWSMQIANKGILPVLKHWTEDIWESGGQVQPWHKMEVSGYLHVLADFLLEKEPQYLLDTKHQYDFFYHFWTPKVTS
jgi:hypothetical protein